MLHPGTQGWCARAGGLCPHLQNGGSLFADLTLAAAVEMLLVAKKAAGRRSAYLTSLRQYLARFVKGREALPICHLRLEDVEKWIALQSNQNSRSTHLNRISTLFAFAVKRGWLHSNPCDRIERISVDAKEIRVLTPEQAGALVRDTPAACKPYLVLCLYAGIRPTEALRLDWAAIDLRAGTVVVSEAASKVRARRVVPLCKLAVKLLTPLAKPAGPVSPAAMTIRRWKRKCRDLLGGTWPADILRHSALSYHLAMNGDLGKTATMAGNSVAILKKHYDAVVSRAAAERFFNP